MKLNKLVKDLDTFNIIVKGDCIRGNILSKRNIRIDGEVIGAVKSEGEIIIGPEAYIEGNIIACELIVEGCIKGTVYVKKKIHVKSTAKIDGNITCAEYVLDLGAIYNGTCRMEELK